MRYKIVVDSCCELPQNLKNDERFEIVPLTLIVGDSYEKEDNMAFDQREFLDAVASCPQCPKSACPSPERYRTAYETEAAHVYAVTLSSKLSGSYNSAVLGKNLYHEKYGEKEIYVIDSKSAACGETQIAYKIMELEEQELSFEEITGKLEQFEYVFCAGKSGYAQEKWQAFRCQGAGGFHAQYQACDGRRRWQHHPARTGHRDEKGTGKDGRDCGGGSGGSREEAADDHALQQSQGSGVCAPPH